jgi:hypothetical protein
MTADEFNAFWAMVGAIVLIPSAVMWMRKRLDTQSVRDRWREVDRIARNRAREERSNGR